MLLLIKIFFLTKERTMKFLTISFALLISSSVAHAEDLSSCHQACFEKKTNCNSKKSHTVNACHDELFACKSSCKSGKPQEAYRESPFFEISLNPVVELDS